MQHQRLRPIPSRDRIVLAGLLAASLVLPASSRAGEDPPAPLPAAEIDCGDECPRVNLGCGATLQGALAEGDCAAKAGDGQRLYDVYELDNPEYRKARIRVAADDFEPEIRLYSPAGGPFPCDLIRGGSDACDPGNAKRTCIEQVLGAPRDGSKFFVAVTSAGGAITGSYSISLECERLPCSPSCISGLLGCGLPQSATMPPAASAPCLDPDGKAFQSWRVDPAAFGGAPATLEVTVTTAFPARVGLSVSNFYGCGEILHPEACTEGNCFKVSLQPGNYRIVVTDDGGEGGSYDISLACKPAPGCKDCLAGTIQVGSEALGRIDSADCAILDAFSELPSTNALEAWRIEDSEGGSFIVQMDQIVSPIPLDLDCNYLDWPSVPCADPNALCFLGTLPAGGAAFVQAQAFYSGVVAEPPVEHKISVTRVDLGACGACSRGPIACGETREGSIAVEGCKGKDGRPAQAWSFSYFDGVPVDIKVTARGTGFTPRLEMTDVLCEPLKTGSASGDGVATLELSTAFIQSHFVVSGSTPEDAGNYEIVVECVPFSPCAQTCRAGSLAPGQTVEGALEPTDCGAEGQPRTDTWSFTIAAKGLYELTSDTRQAQLSTLLVDSACAILAGIGRRTLVALDVGEHFIAVSETTPGSGGPYKLSARAFDCSLCPAPGALECKESGEWEGRLGPEGCLDERGVPYQAWTLDVDYTKSISYWAESDQLTGSFWLFQDDCVLKDSFNQIQQKPHGFVVNAVFEPGRYTFLFSSDSPEAAGSFELHLICKDLDFCEAPCSAGSIRCGEMIEGELKSTDCVARGTTTFQSYRLDLPAAASVTLRTEADGPNVPSAIIFDSQCRFLFNKVCEFPPEGNQICRLEAGTYTIAVAAPPFVSLTQPLPFRLFVEADPCPPDDARLPGDASADGSLNITDALHGLGYLFLGEEGPLGCPAPEGKGTSGFEVLDWDGDGRLNISDPIQLLRYLFVGGPPHSMGIECRSFAGCAAACVR